MPYPKQLKTIALHTPILGNIVRERDRLRHDLASVLVERDQLKIDLASIGCRVNVSARPPEELAAIRTFIASLTSAPSALPEMKAASEAGVSHEEYERKIALEIGNYAHVTNVANLPEIHGYWADTYVRPLLEQFGFSNEQSFYLGYIERMLVALPDRMVRIINLGSGNCELEVYLATALVEKGYQQFEIECVDLNPAMLERGRALATEQGVVERLRFSSSDINRWAPHDRYDIVIANHALHHFVELEHIFDQIRAHLRPEGFFLTHDMIGRNGHMRWPEALDVVNRLWRQVPESCKYNQLLKRHEPKYINFDCSKEGFEGIRAQDILPLLIERFGFELFVPFANVIDIFVDRCFGHNFDARQKWATDFIDQVQQLDQSMIEAGEIKPTHMYAAMCLDRDRPTRVFKHLTPRFGVRTVGV